MASDEMEISIDSAGQVTVRTIGVKGPRCLDYAEAVARIVGREKSRELTNEYYESQEAPQAHVDVRQTR